MAEYAYFSEGILAKTDWNNLVEAIQLNLNYLEGFTGKNLTYIQGARNVIPRPVWSWNRVDAAGDIQAEALTARIDAVRAAIGFDPFEWPAGMVAGMAAGGRMLSATDARTLARAVGCPYTASQTQYPAAASVESVGTHLERRTGYEPKMTPQYVGGKLQYLFTAGTAGVTTTAKTANPSMQAIGYPGIYVPPFPGMPEPGGWHGETPIEKIKSIAHAMSECLAWPSAAHIIEKWYNTGAFGSFLSSIYPSGIFLGALSINGSQPIQGNIFPGPSIARFSPSQYPYIEPYDSSYDIDAPSIICSQFAEFDINPDTHITDAAYSPQMAIISKPTAKNAKKISMTINMITQRGLVSNEQGVLTVLLPWVYKIDSIEESTVALPTTFKAMLLESPFTGSPTNISNFTSGTGAVADYSSETAFAIGCAIASNWDGFPASDEAQIDDLTSYIEYTAADQVLQDERGPIMKRIVSYAEVDFTIPIVWLASRR